MKICTVWSRTVDRATDKFWTLLAKGHSKKAPVRNFTVPIKLGTILHTLLID